MAERGTRAVALFRPRYRHNVFSKLHPVLFVEASPSSMRYSISLRRTDVVSTLRGPRALSSGRAGGGKQPQFTCGVKRKASVQAPQPVQRVQGRRAFVLRGRRCRPRALSGGRVARAAQAEFTSAVSKARSVQAPCPYSATSADGQSWYTGEGMKQVQRERIRQEDGRIVTVLPGHGRL